MRYEREYPGTIAAAVVHDNPAAWKVIDGILDRVVAEAKSVPQPFYKDRYSQVDPALSAIQSRYRTACRVPNNGIWVIHHLIPFVAVERLPIPAQQAFVTAGWNIDRALNLMPLPGNMQTYTGFPNLSEFPIHRGPHLIYTAHVEMWLQPIAAPAVLADVSPSSVLLQLTLLELRLRAYLIERLPDVHINLR